MLMQTVLGLFVLYRIMTGQEPMPGSKPAAKPGDAPAPAPQGAVFPSAPPATLPPFPGPGWCEDDPPPSEVSTRASALMASLWASGAPGARVTELTGGRWIVYAAELDKATGQRAVHVYRSVNCPPLPSQVPAVVVPAAAPAASPAASAPATKAPADAPAASPAPMPTASPASASSPPAAAPAPASTTVTIGPAVDVTPIPQPAATPQVFTPTPVQSAAIAMATALTARSSDGTSGGAYRKRDVPAYKAFQSAAGLKPDGYPGTGTMTMLDAILSQAGVPAPSVPIYPWKAAGGWNHPNAPTSAEWNS